MVFSLAKFFIFGRKWPNVAARDNTCNHCRKWFKLGMEAYNGHELSPQKSSVDLRYMKIPPGIFEGARLARKGESGSTSMLTPHTNDSNFFSCPPMSKSCKHANMVLSFDNFSTYWDLFISKMPENWPHVTLVANLLRILQTWHGGLTWPWVVTPKILCWFKKKVNKPACVFSEDAMLAPWRARTRAPPCLQYLQMMPT